MLKQMKQIRNIIMAWLLCVVPMASFAQLKKTATIEKLKSFTNGSVTLTKTMTEKGDTYSVIFYAIIRSFMTLLSFYWVIKRLR